MMNQIFIRKAKGRTLESAARRYKPNCWSYVRVNVCITSRESSDAYPQKQVGALVHLHHPSHRCTYEHPQGSGRALLGA